MSRPTPARIAAKKRRARLRSAQRRTKPVPHDWPGCSPAAVLPYLNIMEACTADTTKVRYLPRLTTATNPAGHLP